MVFKSLCGLVVKVDLSFSSCNSIQGVIGIVQVQPQPILTANLSPRLQHIRLKGISGLRELESRFSRKDTRFYNAVTKSIFHLQIQVFLKKMIFSLSRKLDLQATTIYSCTTSTLLKSASAHSHTY